MKYPSEWWASLAVPGLGRERSYSDQVELMVTLAADSDTLMRQLRDLWRVRQFRHPVSESPDMIWQFYDMIWSVLCIKGFAFIQCDMNFETRISILYANSNS